MGMRDFQRELAALDAIERTGTGDITNAPPQAANYKVLEIALRNDINALRAFPNRAEKNQFKRDKLLPKWRPFVDEYLRAGKIYQNDYFLYCIVWLFDLADFGEALQLADRAIAQGQAMPAEWKSRLPDFVATQIFNWADKQSAAGQSVEPYFSQTLAKVLDKWQTHEQIVAKYSKLAAALLLRNERGAVQAAAINDAEDLVLAIQLCNLANVVAPKIGVKNMVERAQARLNALKKMGLYNPADYPPVAGLSLEKPQINLERVLEKLNPAHSTAQTETKGGLNV